MTTLPRYLKRHLVATDDFNRADADPIGGDWVQLNSGVSRIRVNANE